MSDMEPKGGLKAGPDEPLKPAEAGLAELAEKCAVDIGSCYACKKCTNGCPMTFAMDLMPHQVVRLIQLGQLDKVKNSSTPWICASCQTCLTRCPNEVDLPRFMDWVKQTLHEGDQSIEQKNTLAFHRAFMKEVVNRGRSFEGGLMTRYMLGTGQAFGPEAINYAKLGWQMFKKGRLEVLPHGIKDKGFLKRLFKEEGE
jgi:heterodisulfide reductase subunit C